jgi:hypothetical protein
MCNVWASQDQWSGVGLFKWPVTGWSWVAKSGRGSGPRGDKARRPRMGTLAQGGARHSVLVDTRHD